MLSTAFSAPAQMSSSDAMSAKSRVIGILSKQAFEAAKADSSDPANPHNRAMVASLAELLSTDGIEKHAPDILEAVRVNATSLAQDNQLSGDIKSSLQNVMKINVRRATRESAQIKYAAARKGPANVTPLIPAVRQQV